MFTFIFLLVKILDFALFYTLNRELYNTKSKAFKKISHFIKMTQMTM